MLGNRFYVTRSASPEQLERGIKLERDVAACARRAFKGRVVAEDLSRVHFPGMDADIYAQSNPAIDTVSVFLCEHGRGIHDEADKTTQIFTVIDDGDSYLVRATDDDLRAALMERFSRHTQNARGQTHIKISPKAQKLKALLRRTRGQVFDHYGLTLGGSAPKNPEA